MKFNISRNLSKYIRFIDTFIGTQKMLCISLISRQNNETAAEKKTIVTSAYIVTHQQYIIVQYKTTTVKFLLV